MRSASWFVIPAVIGSSLGAQTPSKASVREATATAAAVLDDWYLAAARSDEERYFGHMAPDAVFVGIDERERWTKEEFKRVYHPLFEARQMWNFKLIKRSIEVSTGGDVAWFDERLAAPGQVVFRGTGVMEFDGQTWLIKQYALSFPIPRETFDQVIRLLQGSNGASENAPAPQPKVEPSK